MRQIDKQWEEKIITEAKQKHDFKNPPARRLAGTRNIEQCAKDKNVSDIVVVLDEKADGFTVKIVNLKTKGIKEVPLWTQQQWREHIYKEIEEKYGEETANFFRENSR